MAEGILVVTGGASGIGLACAKAMAGAHAAVVLVDANAAALPAAREAIAGAPVHTFECDVADAAAQVALAERVEREIGPVRTLVTSAGILNNSDTVMDMDLAEHARVWDVNYNGTVYSVRAFARGMTARRQGAILTIGSINSFAPLPLPAYCPSKTAILRLTQLLAVELGRFGIRVNGVAPTYVLSPALKARIEAGTRDPDKIRTAGAIEMFVYPEDIANVAAFLCSEKAKAITGTMVPVDAGWEAATAYRTYTGGLPWEQGE
jgi:NAD(P)-dependent dehydrogenase (short-subunit alcohol dehydrogenase family)